MHTYDVPHWTAQDEQEFVLLCEEAGFGNSFTLDLEITCQPLDPKIFPRCPRSPFTTRTQKCRENGRNTRRKTRKQTATGAHHDPRLNYMPHPPKQIIEIPTPSTTSESSRKSQLLHRTASNAPVLKKPNALTWSNQSRGKKTGFKFDSTEYSKTANIYTADNESSTHSLASLSGVECVSGTSPSPKPAECTGCQIDITGSSPHVSESGSIVTSNNGHAFGSSTLHGQSSAHFGDAYHVHHHHHHHHEDGKSSKVTAVSAASGAIVGGSLVGALMTTLQRANSSASSSVASTVSTISLSTVDSVFSSHRGAEPMMTEDDFELPELTPESSKQFLLQSDVETISKDSPLATHDVFASGQPSDAVDSVELARKMTFDSLELSETSGHEYPLAQIQDAVKENAAFPVSRKTKSVDYNVSYDHHHGASNRLSQEASGKQPDSLAGLEDRQPRLSQRKRQVSTSSELWTSLSRSLDHLHNLDCPNALSCTDEVLPHQLKWALRSCLKFDVTTTAWNTRHEDRLQRAFKTYLGNCISDLLQSGAVFVPTAPIELQEVLARYIGENQNLSMAMHLLQTALDGKAYHDVNTAYAANVLGSVYCVTGQVDKAVELHTLTLQQIPQTNAELRCAVLHRLGMAYAYQTVPMALQYLWPALFGMVTVCGASNLSVFYMLRDITSICQRTGRHEEASTAIDVLLQALKEESEASSIFPPPRKLANPRNLTFAQLPLDEVLEILDELHARKVAALRELQSSMSQQEYADNLAEFGAVIKQIKSRVSLI